MHLLSVRFYGGQNVRYGPLIGPTFHMLKCRGYITISDYRKILQLK